MKTANLIIYDQVIPYKIRVSERAQRLRIAVYTDGEVVVTRPRATTDENLKQFVDYKRDWIWRKLEWNKTLCVVELKESSRKHFLEHKLSALSLVRQKTEHWNEKYHFEYNRIYIKPLKSRWGSCSKRGNLSFNYKILFLPEKFQDYIIVHELCHLKELSHSAKFWNLVERTLPNYAELNKVVKRI